MRIVCFFIFLLLLVQRPLQAQSFADAPASLLTAQQIALLDVQGKKAFISFDAKLLTLIVFLSPECPLCRNYTLVLNKLQQQFLQVLQLVGIVPGNAYEAGAIKNFETAYRLQFPLLQDPQKKLADYVAATITPEAVLMNSDGKIVYRGAIDDWVEELGKKKLKAEKNYLQDAISQYLAGQTIAVKKTIPKGCYINEF